MTRHRSQFQQYSIRHSDLVQVGNSQHCAIIGIDTIELNLPGGFTLVLHNVRHVPKLSSLLISVGQLDRNNIHARFSSGGWMLHIGNLLLAQGPKVHSLYPLYVIRREGDLFPHVIALAWTTETPQQGRHHAPIQSRLHPQILLLGSPILRALLVRQTGSRIMLSRGQKYKLVKLVKRR